MGRKKKSFHKPSVQIETGDDKYDNQAGRIEAINSWDDIEHDSEDECNLSFKFLLNTLLFIKNNQLNRL
jgi:hypothetical protein